jgi:hypothetical protein
MKKGIILLALLVSFGLAFAQEKTAKPKKDWSKIDLSDRPKDHFLFQIGYLTWLQQPDTLVTGGIPRTANVYFSFDFPFKTNPQFSVGLGAGIGTDHMYFDKNAGRNLNIVNNTGFQFNRHSGTDTLNKYKSIKLQTAYLEAPIELRFTANPEKPNQSFKFALGVKIGTLLAAIDKTRFERDGAGQLQYATKEKGKKHFNSLRLAATARIGYGNFGLFAQYQINDFIKEGRGPNLIRPFTIGLTLSGL